MNIRNIIFKNSLIFKFLVIICVIFISIGFITKNKLLDIADNSMISVWDSLIYGFNLNYSNEISLEWISVILVYILLLFILIKIIGEYLSSAKYFYLIRIKSYKKYIKEIIISSYLIIIIYFIIQYIIIILVNSEFTFFIKEGLYQNIYSNKHSYFGVIIGMFILNNLIAMVFANIIIITSIYYGKIKKSAFITLTLFFLGLFGKIKLIPGYNIFIFRNLTENGAFKYVYLIYYLIFVLASLTLIIHAIESKKDFILNDYNL